MQTHKKFVAYYEAQSVAPATLQRFQAQMQRIQALLPESGGRPLRVLDLGCAAGANAAIWAEAGHHVIGVDISPELIELARSRASDRGLDAQFVVGSADRVPVADGWADVCLAPELLEHVPDWERCLDEVTRVLRPGGAVFLSTTNTLCPSQQEFNLPLFSWYPGWLKRRLIALTIARRPDLANYAPYPAVNWFNFYSLRAALHTRDYDAVYGQFDLPLSTWSGLKRRIARTIARNASARLLSCMALPGTQIYALKSADGPAATR